MSERVISLLMDNQAEFTHIFPDLMTIMGISACF